MSDVMSYLFETDAIKFCEENKPFWYTSGKIGPYFINTHFVYGNEKEASELLAFIDECLNDKLTLPEKVFKKVFKQYETNETYRTVINTMKAYIENNINIDEIDYISGGERRDWFFSNIISYLLNKPHLSIYKDLSVVESNKSFNNSHLIKSLENKKVLHIADLTTVASSYIRAWIPAIRNLGSEIYWSCVVVDRMQGGKEKIEAEGIKSLSLVQVDKKLFDYALNSNIINQTQYDMLNSFLKNPDESMKQFLVSHPEFIKNSLNSDEKTRKRAKLLIDENLYGLN